jgi:hypothetical protein
MEDIFEQLGIEGSDYANTRMGRGCYRSTNDGDE